MPGLTEQERAEILARRQGGGTSTESTPGSFSPFPGMEVQGGTMGRSGPSLKFGPKKDLGTPSTESERKATRVAKVAMVPLQEIRQLLNIEGNVVKKRSPISLTRPSGYSDPFMSTKQKALRDKLNRTWDLLAMLRTGVAGEAAQKKSLKAQSNIGESDSSETIVERITSMEREIQGFATGELKSPLDEQSSTALTPGEGVDFSQYTDEELRLIIGE